MASIITLTKQCGVYHPIGYGCKEIKSMRYLSFPCKIPSLSLGYRTASLLELNRGKVNPRAAQRWNFLAKISRGPKQQSAMISWLLGPWSANVVCVCVFIQALHHVWLFATPWTAASQASLSCTISWSLLMSVESVILSNAGLLNRETYSPPLSMNTFQNPWTWVCGLSCSSKLIGQQTCIMLSSYYAK